MVCTVLRKKVKTEKRVCVVWKWKWQGERRGKRGGVWSSKVSTEKRENGGEENICMACVFWTIILSPPPPHTPCLPLTLLPSLPHPANCLTKLSAEMEIGIMVKFLGLMNLKSTLSCLINIQERDPCLCDLLEKKIYIFKPVWMTWTFFEGHSCMSNQKGLHSFSCCFLNDIGWNVCFSNLFIMEANVKFLRHNQYSRERTVHL